MNTIDTLVKRYAAAESLSLNGAEIVAVADPTGARLNAALRRVMLAAREDPSLWEDIIQPAKFLRWRLATSLRTDTALDIAAEIERQERRLQFALTDASLPRELASAARAAAEGQSPLANALLDMISQAGPERCLLVAASRPSQAVLSSSWGTVGVRVLTAAELAREERCIDHAYAVGPPRFFGASLVTAPAALSVSFLIPSWIHDRTLPSSALTAYADSGAMFIKSHTRTVGVEEPVSGVESPEDSAPLEQTCEIPDDLLPQPIWEEPAVPHHSPGNDEVLARKVLLAGGQAIWLDDNDGERIRALDPAAPSGERVQYAKLATVLPGAYLLLREGASGHGAMQSIASRLLGKDAAGIDATQQAWKNKLDRRITASGVAKVEHDLRRFGVQSVGRASAWTESSLILPKNDEDFRALLNWLGIPAEPTVSNAKRLRRAHHQAGSDVREALEQAVEETDLTGLERDGRIALRARAQGFRDMVAVRVLAISPNAQVIPHHQARVLFDDRSARWLE
jgi:hypothetical protein